MCWGSVASWSVGKAGSELGRLESRMNTEKRNNRIS